ncbi:hypothetical protein [Streptodolium elevatio]
MRSSNLAPYRISQLLPQDINLRDGEQQSIRCPECHTWRRIRRGMVWPHHPDGERCTGSSRRVILDITVEEWEQRLTEAIDATACRRPTKVTPKPKALPTPAIVQMAHRRPTPRQIPGQRAAEWAAVLPAVQAADDQRAFRPVGATPACGPEVPTESLRISV